MAEETMLVFPSVSAFFVQKLRKIMIEGGCLTPESFVEVFVFHSIHLPFG
jgi:hypothetical protein